MDPVFKTRLNIQEAQIIQDSLDRVRIRYVPANGFPSRAPVVTEELRAHMGEVHAELQPVATLPRGPNGRFRAVINRMGSR